VDVVSLADDLSSGSQMGLQVASKMKASWNLIKDRLISGGNTTGHTLSVTAAPFTAITAIAYGPGLDSNRYGDGEIQYTNSGTAWQFRAPGDPHFGDPVVAAADGSYVLKSWNPSKFITVTLDVSSATTNGRTAISFTSTNNEFDGINKLCASDMIRAAAGADGDVFDLGILDDLLLLEKGRTNRAFFMNGTLINRYKASLRALGGTTPSHMSLPGYAGQTLEYAGVPILLNENIPSTESKGTSNGILTSIYLASLDAEVGLFLGVPSGGQTLNVDGDPRNTAVMGWRVVQLGELEDKAVRRTRVKWYGCLGLRSTRSLARAINIKTTAT
jgi:hypothetical protein